MASRSKWRRAKRGVFVDLGETYSSCQCRSLCPQRYPWRRRLWSHLLISLGDMLASAGDDGNIILWIPSETYSTTPAMGAEGLEDKETWRIKHMARSSGAEIYDLAWSPDGVYFIIGSMDNVARIYNAHTGQFLPWKLQGQVLTAYRTNDSTHR